MESDKSEIMSEQETPGAPLQGSHELNEQVALSMAVDASTRDSDDPQSATPDQNEVEGSDVHRL